MKNFRRLLLSAASILWWSGCGSDPAGHDHAHDHDQAHPEEVIREHVTFDVKTGVSVSPETARWIGLQTVEVERRELVGEWKCGARIFRESRAGDPSTARVPATAVASLKSDDAAPWRPGAAVRIAGPDGNPMSGRVLSHNRPEHDPEGKVEVLLEIEDESGRLKQGSAVAVSAPFAPSTSVLSIPSMALLQSVEGWFVYVAREDYFARTPITIGRSSDSFVEVKEGLEAGERVVTGGAIALWLTELKFTKAGTACCPVTAKPAP